jgi:hypothetical protein
LFGLPLDGGDDVRMLMAEVAALGEAAHVEDAAAVLREDARAFAADDRRCRPIRLPAPAVQDGFAFGAHAARLD